MSEMMPSSYRKGRRVTVCAAPIAFDAGWRPKVVEKSEDARDRIRSAIGRNILFSGLDGKERDIIVDSMEPKMFDEGAVIIRQGDVGDFFYVIDSGACDYLLDGIGKVGSVGTGGSFGELALMYNAPRAATVVATEPTCTWAMDQLTFKTTLMSTTMKKRKTHEEFVRSVVLLSTLNQYERLTVADALIPVMYATGEVVLREGEPGHDFYFVEEGQVMATKAGVEGEVSRRLERGDYFGELALINNSPRAATITATAPTVCLRLDRATFKRLLGPVEDVLRSNMELYSKFEAAIATASEAAADDVTEEEEDEEESKM